ncbi:MAG: competence/damage-inducible protein A, partial [Vampirovibrionales bacterium]|nr:competence/damage-inducible protein A [Vampirovibrionales bacterium]
MRAEILAIGTELLLGETINSNAAWISRELAALGIDVYHHQTVGDNPARIIACVKEALARSTVLMTTGGLGPTDDDLTVATLAECFQARMVHHPALEKQIRAYFERRDQSFPQTNRKQALLPDGAHPVENPLGTAPGMWWDVSTSLGKPGFIATFPGVPKELFAMWPAVAAHLKALQQEQAEPSMPLVSQDLWFVGIGESQLAQQLTDLMAQESPSVAPYVGQGQIRIRLAVKATSVDAGLKILAPLKSEVLRRVGGYCIGEGHHSLEQMVGHLLRQKSATVAVAESCTGGLLSSRLTDVSGSSAYVSYNVVTYSNRAKSDILGVEEALLARYGAVSAEAAIAMAVGVQKITGATFGLSLTGIAGPDGSTADKPVGLVYIGIAGPNLPHHYPAMAKVVKVNA